MNIEAFLLTAFWIGCAGTVYAYVGFPALAALLAATRRTQSPDVACDDAPVPVTVIIPAYNEEQHLEARIQNVLAADYPQDLLQVLVVSDASTDRTNDIAR